MGAAGRGNRICLGCEHRCKKPINGQQRVLTCLTKPPPLSLSPKFAFLPELPGGGFGVRVCVCERRRLPCCLIVRHVIQGCTCSADSQSEGTRAAESQTSRTRGTKPRARGEPAVLHKSYTSFNTLPTLGSKATEPIRYHPETRITGGEQMQRHDWSISKSIHHPDSRLSKMRV